MQNATPAPQPRPLPPVKRFPMGVSGIKPGSALSLADDVEALEAVGALERSRCSVRLETWLRGSSQAPRYGLEGDDPAAFDPDPARVG